MRRKSRPEKQSKAPPIPTDAKLLAQVLGRLKLGQIRIEDTDHYHTLEPEHSFDAMLREHPGAIPKRGLAIVSNPYYPAGGKFSRNIITQDGRALGLHLFSVPAGARVHAKHVDGVTYYYTLPTREDDGTQINATAAAASRRAIERPSRELASSITLLKAAYQAREMSARRPNYTRPQILRQSSPDWELHGYIPHSFTMPEVVQAVASLPEYQRLVLELHDRDCLYYDAVARATGRTTADVIVNLRDARASVARQLSGAGFFFTPQFQTHFWGLLPPDSRDMLYRARVLRQSSKEIGNELNLPQTTVADRVKAGTIMLRRIALQQNSPQTIQLLEGWRQRSRSSRKKSPELLVQRLPDIIHQTREPSLIVPNNAKTAAADPSHPYRSQAREISRLAELLNDEHYFDGDWATAANLALKIQGDADTRELHYEDFLVNKPLSIERFEDAVNAAILAHGIKSVDSNAILARQAERRAGVHVTAAESELQTVFDHVKSNPRAPIRDWPALVDRALKRIDEPVLRGRTYHDVFHFGIMTERETNAALKQAEQALGRSMLRETNAFLLHRMHALAPQDLDENETALARAYGAQAERRQGKPAFRWRKTIESAFPGTSYADVDATPGQAAPEEIYRAIRFLHDHFGPQTLSTSSISGYSGSLSGDALLLARWAYNQNRKAGLNGGDWARTVEKAMHDHENPVHADFSYRQHVLVRR